MRLGIMYLERTLGVGQIALELARVLAEKVDVTCYLVANNPYLDQFQALPCRTRAFRMRRGYAALAIAMLRGREDSGLAGAIDEDKLDVLLDTGSSWWRGVIERQISRKLVVAEVVLDVTPHPGLMGFLERVHHVVYPSIADIMIGLSNHSFNELARKYPRKARMELRRGVLMANANVDIESIIANRNRFLCFGRIEPYKGIDVLAEAYRLAKQSEPGIELSVVGRGRIKPWLMRKMNRLGISVNNSYISNDQLRTLVAEHGVMVLPYTSATQSGVAALALANGMPCIASDVGALPEQAIPGRNGIIVQPGRPGELAEAMIKIARDEALARRMAEEALRVARERYSWEQIGKDLLRDLTDYLEASKPADC